MTKKKNYEGRVLLCDGNNMLFRGHFATPKLTNHEGFVTSGIKGFFNILIADLYKVDPTHVVIAFDLGGGKNWRKELYPEYKANRGKNKDNPEYLAAIAQIKPLRKLLRATGFRVSGVRGEEADDIIGTLAVNFSKENFHVVINSKDKDLAQLVNQDVNMMVSESRAFLNEKGIIKKYGVHPSQIIDFLALQGDKADNIPGIHKVGEKTAAKLLAQYKTLKRIIKYKEELTPAMLANLEAVEDMFPLTKKLLKIRTDLRLKTTIESAKVPGRVADKVTFNEMCEDLNLIQTRPQIIRVLKGR